MSNSVSDGGAAGPYLDNIEIREGDEEQLLDIVSLGEKVFMSSWNEQMVATSITYDEQHHTNYLETLYQYLLCDGSIQKIAGALFCHRNTVNYRVRILREDLHLALDDPSTRFELMTAFQVHSYLDLFS